jgi:hypothetical protein
MEFHDCMKRVLPRVIEVEPTTENPHDPCFGRICNLPNEPVLQFDFKIVGALAIFGETGSFGGLATFSCLQEGRDNRAVNEGKPLLIEVPVLSTLPQVAKSLNAVFVIFGEPASSPECIPRL